MFVTYDLSINNGTPVWFEIEDLLVDGFPPQGEEGRARGKTILTVPREDLVQLLQLLSILQTQNNILTLNIPTYQ